ncbi:MAG: phage baseplate assembly protein V [Lachnospiraceae bacterium]|nr:phage baseplate assembly protein V [Lachnospiraceae bacterium]
MALYDVIDEIAEKQVLKTDTGDTRIFGVVVGIVVKNYDKDFPGRICVNIPTRDKEANTLKWARLAMPSSGSKWGHYFLPEIDDQVLVVFEQGNIEKPYVIGCVPKDSNQFLKKAADENNQYKKIMTKNGTHITFEDNKEGEGEKDKLQIETAKSAHTFSMDNENKVITLKDKEGKCQVIMKTEEGNISVTAEKKLTVKVGDSIELIMNGSSGAVSLKCNKYTLEASNKINVSTDGMAKFGGANIILDADNTLKAGSSGMTQVAGATIKIG